MMSIAQGLLQLYSSGRLPKGRLHKNRCFGRMFALNMTCYSDAIVPRCSETSTPHRSETSAYHRSKASTPRHSEATAEESMPTTNYTILLYPPPVH